MSNDQIKSRIKRQGVVKWRELLFIQADDFKEWIGTGQEKLERSLLKYQFIDPFKVWETANGNYCLDGRHRYLDLKKLSENGIEVPEELPAIFLDCKDKREAAELTLVYSSAYAGITEKGLSKFVDEYQLQLEDFDAISLPSIPDIEIEMMYNPGADDINGVLPHVKLQERFIVPPFSILDTRQGYWQERKKLWHSLFNSQETREEIEIFSKSGQSTAIYELRNLLRSTLNRDPDWDEIIAYAKAKGKHIFEGASIFDPVLCEVIYSWFCFPDSVIIDPTSGGVVRGAVADMLGHQYYGVDLREDQVQANRKQAEKLDLQKAKWFAGDSVLLSEYLPADLMADFLFTCPPYHDLEEYSDDPRDLSNMSYDYFMQAYESIIYQSVARLKDNRFACFVVSDIRDKSGRYRGFVEDTIRAFRTAGCHLYNEIILINVAGSLPVRVGRQFESFRKVGKTHQNVLVFFKGDPSTIKDNYPQIIVKDLEAEDLDNTKDNPNIALLTPG